jgi:carboxyl-terminal processing protease
MGRVYVLRYTWVKASPTMEKSRVRRVERYVWVSVTAILLAAVVLVALAPRVLAQNREEDRRALLASFQHIFDFVQQNYVDETGVDTRQLMEGAVKGLFDALGDPYSTYLNGDDLRALEDTTTGEYSGIGIVITKEDEAHGAEVVTPIEGTPAYRAGLSAADLIVRIDGEDIRELTLNDIVKRIRGPLGSELTLTVQRGRGLVFDVTVKRESLEVPTVKQAMVPGAIGYLRITQFTPFTARYVRDALRYFDRSAYQGLVVDIRGNGGGRLDSVIEIADLFLDQGPIVSTRGRSRSESQVWNARTSDTLVRSEVPMVVLIDRSSASASEILAGALKDTGRATVLGTTSYGKGTVQQIRSMGTFDFKLTMSRYYTPSGVSIDGKGIVPDIVVQDEELTEAERSPYERLVREGKIRGFVDGVAAGGPSEAEVVQFLASLKSEGFDIRERFLRKLIRDSVNRRDSNPPVFDLDYDVVLSRAVELLGQRIAQNTAQTTAR